METVTPQPTPSSLSHGGVPLCSSVDNRTGRCSPQECFVAGQTGPLNCSLSAYLGSHLSIVGCLWSWWRTQPLPKLHPNIRPYCRARKYLRSAAQWVNVPKDVLEDLIVASRAAIVATPSAFQTVNGCYALPRILVQEMIEVVDSSIEGIPYVPTDGANSQARGLGSMVAFWERMRNKNNALPPLI